MFPICAIEEDDSVKSKTKSKAVPARMGAVIAFLPIFEAIAPDDFAQLVGTTEVPGEIPFMGHLEYHPAVCKFMDFEEVLRSWHITAILRTLKQVASGYSSLP
jgi:hypothetical protein